MYLLSTFGKSYATSIKLFNKNSNAVLGHRFFRRKTCISTYRQSSERLPGPLQGSAWCYLDSSAPIKSVSLLLMSFSHKLKLHVKWGSHVKVFREPANSY
jgi:hypothetical protein